jgi:hypothetical protein
MRIRPFGRVLATALLVAGPSAALLPAQATVGGPADASGTKSVPYLGRSFTVPASWPVISLTAGSDTCVQYDRHAVYLGTPPADEDCPAGTMGRTDALVIQPASAAGSGSGTARASEDAVSHEIDSYAAGISVTATYSSSPDQVRFILASAGLPLPAPDTTIPSNPTPRTRMAPATTTLPAAASRFTGRGFDPCTAPSSSTMNAWKNSSPYGAIGVYLGGVNMGCSQPNLTASWVSAQVSAGWRFFLLYVGPQAPGSSCTSCSTITSASSQGASAAQDAASHAASLGFGAGTPIIYDMEDYAPRGTPAVLSFMSSWTNELHALGYSAGEYSSLSSGISDLIANTGSTTPDVVDFASWDGNASTGDSSIPDADWANHERIHQYSGGVTQTFGGYSINVDQDYLDVQGSFDSPVGGVLGDVTGDGRPDLLAIAPNGDLVVYPNAGGTGVHTFGQAAQVGSGWNGYTIAAVANPYTSGRAGIIAVAPDGTLHYYPNTGGSGMKTFSGSVQIGSGWNGYAILASADVYGAGKPGLLAVAPDGTLDYYPNTGGTATGTFGPPTQVGSGWNGWTVDVADINGDGKPDLLALDSAGALYVYPNTGQATGATFGAPTQVGSGWNGWQAIDVGTLAGSAPAEILGIDASGTLYEYPNTTVGGTVSFGPSTQVGSGWNGYSMD